MPPTSRQSNTGPRISPGDKPPSEHEEDADTPQVTPPRRKMTPTGAIATGLWSCRTFVRIAAHLRSYPQKLVHAVSHCHRRRT